MSEQTESGSILPPNEYSRQGRASHGEEPQGVCSAPPRSAETSAWAREKTRGLPEPSLLDSFETCCAMALKSAHSSLKLSVMFYGVDGCTMP
eukprot:2044251-Amphidinium_carterae.1